MKTIKEKPIIVIGIVIALAVVVSLLVYSGSPDRRLQKQLQMAEKYLEDMDYEQAVAAFTKAIEIDPKCEEAYLGLADTYIKMGDYDSAQRILEQASEFLQTNLITEKMEYIVSLLEQQYTVGIIENTEEPESDKKPEPGTGSAGTQAGEGGGSEETPAEEMTGTGSADPGQIQVSIKKTDIRADSVFNSGGYGSLRIEGSGDWYEDWHENGGWPQAALVDGNGRLVFPYQSTNYRYYVSDSIVSLMESSPYVSYDDLVPPSYYHLDGSSAFVLESGSNEIDDKDVHITESFDWWMSPMMDGYALVIKSIYTFKWYGGAGGGELGFQSYIINKNGTIICTLPEEFNNDIEFGGGDFEVGVSTKRSLGWCGEGLFAVFENEQDGWDFTSEGIGYMDSAGNMVLDLTGRGFTNLFPFHAGLAAVFGNGMIGFIDKTGTLVIPCSYDDFSTGFSQDGICAVKKGGKWGYIDRNNNVVIPFEYDDAYGAGDGLASVVKDGKCGLVDYNNNIAVPLEYDDISSCEKGAAYAVKDGILYVISKAGE